MIVAVKVSDRTEPPPPPNEDDAGFVAYPRTGVRPEGGCTVSGPPPSGSTPVLEGASVEHWYGALSDALQLPAPTRVVFVGSGCYLIEQDVAGGVHVATRCRVGWLFPDLYELGISVNGRTWVTVETFSDEDSVAVAYSKLRAELTALW